MKDLDLKEKVCAILDQKKLTLATAESCTGGLIARKITDVSGCSSVYLGGVVAYANSAKINLLGVNPETLEKFGAVSEQTASEMAKGAAIKFNADIAVSTTGIAGPTGGSIEKPVGLVYVGVFFCGDVHVLRLELSGTREEVREQAADCALNEIVRIFE